MTLAQLQQIIDAINLMTADALKEGREHRAAKRYRKGTLCAAKAEAFAQASTMVARMGLAAICAERPVRDTPAQARAKRVAKQWGF